MTDRRRVVVIGAGLGGIAAARALRKAAVDVLVIDRNNYQTFQPLLYQVASAALEPGEVAHQVRGVLKRQRNADFRQGTVWSVDWDGKQVHLTDGSRVPFDDLVLGAGTVANDFGIPGVKRHALFLKSLPDAINLRAHVLAQFEAANADRSLIEKGALRFVIVGGGPAGVEMAGALTELVDGALKGDYPNLDVARAEVVLIEMQKAPLPLYGERTQAYTRRALAKRGVRLEFGESVAEAREGEVELASGRVFPSKTLVWAAGVRAHPLAEALGVALTRGFRVAVRPDLSIPERPHAFVVGDLAGASDPEGNLYPQLAQVAIQQGRHAGRQIARRAQGLETTPFRYLDKGTMAIIGRGDGVAELSKRFLGLRLRGPAAWFGWLGVHVAFLPSTRARLATLLDWTYVSLTHDHPTRLITSMEPVPAPRTMDGEPFLPTAPDETPNGPALSGSE